MSTQSIASTPRVAESAERCRRCGAPLADDQRYCLECGERRAPASSLLLSTRPEAPGPAPASAATPRFPPGSAPAQAPARGNAVVLLAGIGVLMLAMGVGVLIGRSGAPSQSAGAPAVVTVATPANGSGSASAPASEFVDDWRAGTSGYTVQLQSLPVATTTPTAVMQAKSAASAKGAPSVGALRSDDFSSLSAGSYDIYSGEYHAKAQAEKALAGLKKSFPGASVIRVSGGAGASGGTGAGGSSAGRAGGGAAGGAGGGNSAAGSSSGGSKKSGRSYEQESKNLPNVVTTG